MRCYLLLFVFILPYISCELFCEEHLEAIHSNYHEYLETDCKRAIGLVNKVLGRCDSKSYFMTALILGQFKTTSCSESECSATMECIKSANLNKGRPFHCKSGPQYYGTYACLGRQVAANRCPMAKILLDIIQKAVGDCNDRTCVKDGILYKTLRGAKCQEYIRTEILTGYEHDSESTPAGTSLDPRTCNFVHNNQYMRLCPNEF